MPWLSCGAGALQTRVHSGKAALLRLTATPPRCGWHLYIRIQNGPRAEDAGSVDRKGRDTPTGDGPAQGCGDFPVFSARGSQRRC